MTAYNPATRALLKSDGQITVGSDTTPVTTDPDKGFLDVYRFYEPMEGYINKTWVLSSFELPH